MRAKNPKDLKTRLSKPRPSPPSPVRKLVDGRRQRGEASRERIIRAMLELLHEGEVAPGAEAVALRANVGLRTVFRHFDNMDSLYQQINALISAEIVGPMLRRPFASSDWKERIAEMVERRIAIFERTMPLKIAADVNRHRSAFLAAQGALMVHEQRAAIAAVLEQAGSAVGAGTNSLLLESLDLLLSFDTWRRLRMDQMLTRPKARAVLERMIAGLIREQGPRGSDG